MLAKAALFDLDGTLVDSLPGIELSVDYSLQEANLPARERDLRPLIGPPIRSIFAQLSADADEQQLSLLERAFRASYDSVGWRKTVLHENAIRALQQLRQSGVQLFLVTNKPQFATERILEALSLRKFFRDVLCRDSTHPPFYSKTGMLEALIHSYNLEPTECLYVGDTFEDYRAGAEAGIPVALVTHGYGDIPEELRDPRLRILKNLAELLDLFELVELT